MSCYLLLELGGLPRRGVDPERLWSPQVQPPSGETQGISLPSARIVIMIFLFLVTLAGGLLMNGRVYCDGKIDLARD
jgi:hypothetical protein